MFSTVLVDMKFFLVESTESWEMLSVPSASGKETEETILVSTAQYTSTKAKKSASMERLLIDAQKESLQNSARQSLYHSKRSRYIFPYSGYRKLEF